MRYALCHSCKYFIENVKTPYERKPNHCVHPEVSVLFGLDAGGFISGTDIFHCDYFEQHDAMCGDVLFHLKGGKISYVVPNDRKKRQQYILTDNSKNIREIYERKQSKTRHVEENHQGDDSHSFGLDGCPF